MFTLLSMARKDRIADFRILDSRASPFQSSKRIPSGLRTHESLGNAAWFMQCSGLNVATKKCYSDAEVSRTTRIMVDHVFKTDSMMEAVKRHISWLRDKRAKL